MKKRKLPLWAVLLWLLVRKCLASRSGAVVARVLSVLLCAALASWAALAAWVAARAEETAAQAAWDATWVAARAARDASWDAQDAAEAAARNAQVDMLTQMLREYALQIREMQQAQIDLRQNDTMRILTVVSTIFFPLSLIAGWYGMNFTHMPELSAPYAYFILIGVCILIVAVEIWYFKKKGWF